MTNQKIKTKQEEKISVKWNDSNLFYVPYEQPLNEEEMLRNDADDIMYEVSTQFFDFPYLNLERAIDKE